MSPLAGAGDHQGARYPPVRTIKFATFSRKPTTGMMAVGGLPAEMVLHMLISTRIPPQYGELFASHSNSTTTSVELKGCIKRIDSLGRTSAMTARTERCFLTVSGESGESGLDYRRIRRDKTE